MNQTTLSFVHEANINNSPSRHFMLPKPFFKIDSVSLTTVETLERKVAALEQRLEQTHSRFLDQLRSVATKAVSKERKRIGQELHDNVNQILSCANLCFGQVKAKGDTEQQLKAKGHELILQAINEMRALSHELIASPRVSESCLAEKIRTLIQDFQSATHITVHFINNFSEKALAKGKAITLYRILQEQLKNILLHSKATAVTIVLECNTHCVQLTVQDNGVGKNLSESFAGIGLTNIKERIKLYKGELGITSAPGEGFALHVTFPRSRSPKI